jgi:hypothetical protein
MSKLITVFAPAAVLTAFTKAVPLNSFKINLTDEQKKECIL